MKNKKESGKKAEREFECYCCHKTMAESKGKWVPATSSSRCLDGTDAHKRFVCKACVGTR
ncbi:MAG TPA: hypothetical protein VMW42_00270 [Desulfatiglandales bacterium]|nr:hypothetical protein [Desulfatiglandales bacterium]